MSSFTGLHVWEKAFYQANPYNFQQMKTRGFSDFMNRVFNYLITNEGQVHLKGEYFLRGEDCLFFYQSYFSGKLKVSRKPVLYKRVNSRKGMKNFLNFSSFLGSSSMILGFGPIKEYSYCKVITFFSTEENPEMLLAAMGENNALQMSLDLKGNYLFKTIMCEEFLINKDMHCYPFLGINRSLEKTLQLKKLGVGQFDPNVEVPALVFSKRVRDNSFSSDFVFKEQIFFIQKIREFFKDDLEKEEILTFFFRACMKLDEIDLQSLKKLLDFPTLSEVFRKVSKFSVKKLKGFLKFFRENFEQLRILFLEFQRLFPSEKFDLELIKQSNSPNIEGDEDSLIAA